MSEQPWVRVEMDAPEVQVSVYGAGSADMMARKTRIHLIQGGTRVEIVGTKADLDALKAEIQALDIQW
jgi:hypothetical protein